MSAIFSGNISFELLVPLLLPAASRLPALLFLYSVRSNHGTPFEIYVLTSGSRRADPKAATFGRKTNQSARSRRKDKSERENLFSPFGAPFLRWHTTDIEGSDASLTACTDAILRCPTLPDFCS